MLRLLRVGILSLIAVLSVLLLAIMYWRSRGAVDVDLSDPSDRRRSAAQWMMEGEEQEAERMLRAAVKVLRDWPQAVARGDLASLLIASARNEEAIQELEDACQVSFATEDQEEMLEMRVRLSHLLGGAGREEQGVLLLQELAEHEDLTFAALAQEALGEFYLELGHYQKAAGWLRDAQAHLGPLAHDRAASTTVSLAMARQGLGESEQWQSMKELSADLQSAAVVNFCDRIPQLPASMARPLADALLQRLLGNDAWQWEREQLEAAMQQL